MAGFLEVVILASTSLRHHCTRNSVGIPVDISRSTRLELVFCVSNVMHFAYHYLLTSSPFFHIFACGDFSPLRVQPSCTNPKAFACSFNTVIVVFVQMGNNCSAQFIGNLRKHNSPILAANIVELEKTHAR